MANKLVTLALKEKRKILVVRKVKETIKESCYEDILAAIDNLEVGHFFDSKVSPLEISCSNGSRFIFRGLDKVTKIKSIKDIDTIWIEEAAEISLNDFKELKKRLRIPDKKKYLFITANPSEISHWLAKYIEKITTLENLYEQKMIVHTNHYNNYDEKIILHHSTYKDNYFLDEAFKSDLENEKNALWKAIGTDGRFGNAGEKVFDNVVIIPSNQMLKEIETKQTLVGFDFGFATSYNAIVYCHVDSENNDLYISREFYENRLTDKEMLERDIINDIMQNNYVIYADSAEPKAIQVYKDNGLRINPAKKIANNQMQGVRKLWTFRNIYVSKELTPNVHRELLELNFYINENGIVAKSPRSGKIFTFDAHTFDAINYALTSYNPTKLNKHRYRDKEDMEL